MSTEEQKKIDLLLLLGAAKLFSEKSTSLINELTDTKQKHHYDQAVKYIDKFIKVTEKGIGKQSPLHLETLEILIVAMNNGMTNLRKELVTGISEIENAD